MFAKIDINQSLIALPDSGTDPVPRDEGGGRRARGDPQGPPLEEDVPVTRLQ